MEGELLISISDTIEYIQNKFTCGGNTFTLLKFAKEANFGASIQSLLNRGGIYIGVSAGSLILSPTIDVVNETSLDLNEIGLTDLTALNVVPFHVKVHFEESQEEVRCCSRTTK